MEGWSDRLKYLEKSKKQAELISIMKDVNDIDHRIADEKKKRNLAGRAEWTLLTK